jgi:tRNA 2-thiouridine synthesizing protein E
MTSPSVDKEGFLRNLDDWSPEVAEALALTDGIRLTEEHWEILRLVRDYYRCYHLSPATRVLVRLVGERLGPEKGQSIHLMRLFSGKPAKLVSKIAGLPKPANCD